MIALKTDADGRVTHRHYRPDDIDTTDWTLVEELPPRPAVDATEKAVLYADDQGVRWEVEAVPFLSIPADTVPERPEDVTELVIATDSMTAEWQ